MFGDLIHRAMAVIGVTPERVSAWLGRECNCEERRAKLNALDLWARQAVKSGAEEARRFLNDIIGATEEGGQP